MKKVKEPVGAFKAILISSGAVLGIMLVLCLLCGVYLQSKASPEDYYKVTAVVIPVASSLIGGLLCAFLSRGKGLVRGFAVGMLAGLLINVTGIVLAPSASAEVLGIVMPFVYCALSGAIGGALGVNMIKGGRRS